VPKIIRCDASDVGLDELADFLLERHLAKQLADARLQSGIGSESGRLLGPQGGVDHSCGLRSQDYAGRQRNQAQNHFQSEPYVSEFHGNTRRALLRGGILG
jgi:hypothetical protein